MRLAASQLERLKFLTRVVKKEIQHLKYSADKVFSKPFTVTIAKQLNDNEQLAEQVEAFSSRFCRLQDTIGDKLLPALDTAHKHLGFIVGVAESIINNIEERKLCSR